MTKKLSYIAIVYFLCRAFFIGVSFSLILKFSEQDSWLSFLIAFWIGFIVLFFIQYIASYKPQMTLKEKYQNLFPIISPILIGITVILFFFLATISLWNLSNLITSQFLDKTPKLVISISFLIPILLLISKPEKIISRVSLILFYISIILFIISFNGLIFQFDLSNFKPLFTTNITSGILPYISFQVFPIFLILIFPNDEISKNIKKGYCFASLILFLVTIIIIGVLGVKLAHIYQYPEFHILKRAYQGILTYRLENILSIQWIFDIFIFCSIAFKGCNHLMGWDKGWKINIFPILAFLLSIYIFKDNTIANLFTENILMYIIPILMSITILLFAIKICIKKRRKSPI